MMRSEAPTLGMSLYLSEPEPENLARLDQAGRHGVGVAFTSLHIPEDTNAAEQPRMLRRLGEMAQDMGIALYADISPLTLTRLDLPGGDDAERVLALAEWGLGGVRFDDGFDMGVVARVSRGMLVQLNASTINDHDIDSLHSSRADFTRIEALHNYYPRPDTGLGLAAYGRMNLGLRAAGLRVGAFAPGDGALRGPLFEGLPTCEDHRRADPLRAAVELWHGPAPQQGADSVYVGDIDLAADTWRRWLMLADGVIPLRWTISALDPAERAVAELLASSPASNRRDSSDRVIRLREFRPMIGETSLLAATGRALADGTPGAGAPRPRGAVTVDNTGYGRYAGEVQIAITELPPDPRVTVVGHVIDTDLPLLGLIPGGGRLRLVT